MLHFTLTVAKQISFIIKFNSKLIQNLDKICYIWLVFHG